MNNRSWSKDLAEGDSSDLPNGESKSAVGAAAISGLYLHHGALSVSDMSRSIEFYGRVLGFSVDTRIEVHEGNLEIVHLKNANSYLELFCRTGAKPLPEHATDHEKDFGVVGTKHLALGTNAPEVIHLQLERSGVSGLTPIYDSPHYKYFFFQDPDGIVLEIVHRK